MEIDEWRNEIDKWRMEEDKKRSKAERRIILVVALLLAGAAGYFVLHRWKARTAYESMKTCQENLTRLDGAKEQWGLEMNKKPEDVPSFSDLVGPGKYLEEMPRCPSGYGYELNAIGSYPICRSGLPRHLNEYHNCPITDLE